MKIAFADSKAEVEAHYMVRMWQSVLPSMQGKYSDDSSSVDLDSVVNAAELTAEDLVDLAVVDGRFSNVDAETMYELAFDFLFKGVDR